ncbi:GDSL-type esterase/lipase family protein [Streptomyces sp. T028]|uniref:GDSL-type esterase/lipase family protein n=1 Tax=Streptomyces sp. T028 TaxID=3394379 RepID=UPI003A888170
MADAPSPPEATYRLVVRPTLEGCGARIRLTNSAGVPLRVAAATVAERRGRAGAAVNASTLRPLRFGGRAGASVGPGAGLLSDPVDLPVRALRDLVVSLYVPTPTPQSVHAQTYVTQYVTAAGAGDRTSESEGAAFTSLQEPVPWLDAVEVLTEAPRSIVAIGDSITDGDQAFPPFNDDAMMDTYERWTDVVARRIAADPDLARAGIVNQGVNGDITTGVLARLDRDVLDLAGVTDVVVEIGTNDLTIGRSAQQVIGNLTEIATRLREGGLRVTGATLPPRGAYAHADKAAVNRFIRTSPLFDDVFDLERILGRTGHPDALRAGYDSGDTLHPTPTGYEAMGEALDLAFLRSESGRCQGHGPTGHIDPGHPLLRYEGRWNIRPGLATTVNSGSRITLRFTGTAVDARFDRDRITAPPEIYAYVDGEKTDRIVVDRDVIRLTRDDLPARTHTLVLAVKDVYENANRWQPPLASGVRFAGLDLADGTVLEELPPAPAHRFTFLGDSITQGVNLHCASVTSECADGTLAYPWLVAKAFGAGLEQVGFGGQGVTKGGNDGVPRAQDAIGLNHAGSSAAAFDAAVVVINQTTNDMKAPSDHVREGYLQLLREVRTRYPHAVIVALEPFGVAGVAIATAPATRSAVAEPGDSRTSYVSTRGWLDAADFTDTLHPNAKGHRKAATRLVDAITDLTGIEQPWRGLAAAGTRRPC